MTVLGWATLRGRGCCEGPAVFVDWTEDFLLFAHCQCTNHTPSQQYSCMKQVRLTMGTCLSATDCTDDQVLPIASTWPDTTDLVYMIR